MTDAPEQPLHSEILWMPSRVPLPDGSRMARLMATFYPGLQPPPPRGWPLVVFSHGSTAGGRHRTDEVLRFEIQARYFLARGFAMLVPMRRGRGGSESDYVEWYDPDPLKLGEGLHHALDDLDAAIAFMRNRDDIDGSRIVVAGQSRGGLLSVLYAGQHGSGLRGSINFSGGWNDIAGATNVFTRDMLLRIGGDAMVPSLWLYAANDSMFAPDIVRQWHDAYASTGGHAQLYVFPPLEGADGHCLLDHPDLWQSAVDAFLHQLGFGW